MSDVKRCTRCGESKPLSQFPKRSDRNSLLSWCRMCKRAYDAAAVAAKRARRRYLGRERRERA